MTQIQHISKKANCQFLYGSKLEFQKSGLLSKEEWNYLDKKWKAKNYNFSINRLSDLFIIQLRDAFDKKSDAAILEGLRDSGHKACQLANTHAYDHLFVNSLDGNTDKTLAMAEGAVLGNYQFIHYRKDFEKIQNKVKQVYVPKQVSSKEISRLQHLCQAVYTARNWVNEPQNIINSLSLAESIKKEAKKAGAHVEVLHKKQIEALKMGGLLAVNQGSVIPPTFSIIEYKGLKAINKKPIVLVGKGVVYDTGGLSLKPTPNSMDSMKCDMAGAACVAATVIAIAQMKLPLHVIALIPSTDNRPGGDAYTPGDVITFSDGQSCEVLNTDAEGRLILADALIYAQRYKPELVLDFATLTGAAAAAIGQYGIVCMGTASEEIKNKLKTAGSQVHERLAEFPFWDDYAALIKSDIADMKNIGGPIAGAITAGKFLEKFTDYPWMHFDIAGPAFINGADSYRGKHGTGTGVRLLIEFLSNYSNKK